MRNITKDRWRVMEQLQPHIMTLEGKPKHKVWASLCKTTNYDLAKLWLAVKGYEMRYVGDDLFQCEEE